MIFQQLNFNLPVIVLIGLLLPLFTACSSSNKATKSPGTIENKSEKINGEVNPKIKGGIQSLWEKVEYPKEARKKKIQGRVTVGVYVEENGDVNEISIINSPHPLLSRAAKKAVRKTTFIPGRQDGKPVRVYMTFPVLFRLR